MIKKRRFLIFLFVFVALVSLYYFGVKPLLLDDDGNFHYKDDFDKLDVKFWYVGSMQDHEEIQSSADIKNGVLTLKKDVNEEDVYFLSKPIPINKKQILTIKRKVKIDPKNKYFCGGIAVFQTSSKSRIIDTDDKHPFGSALFTVEYVHNMTGKGERPGKHAVRILFSKWEENSDYLLIPPIYNQYYDEEIVYNNYTGLLQYKINGEVYEKTIDTVEDENIRIWMHAYGNSYKQSVEVDSISIDIENVEDSDMGK